MNVLTDLMNHKSIFHSPETRGKGDIVKINTIFPFQEKRQLSPEKYSSAAIYGNNSYHLSVPVIILSILHIIFHKIFRETTLVETIITPILQMKNMKHKEVTQCHTQFIRGRVRVSLYLGSVSREPAFLPIMSLASFPHQAIAKMYENNAEESTLKQTVTDCSCVCVCLTLCFWSPVSFPKVLISPTYSYNYKPWLTALVIKVISVCGAGN